MISSKCNAAINTFHFTLFATAVIDSVNCAGAFLSNLVVFFPQATIHFRPEAGAKLYDSVREESKCVRPVHRKERTDSKE